MGRSCPGCCRPSFRAGCTSALGSFAGFGAGTELTEASDETVAPPPPRQVSLSGWQHRSGLNPSRPLVSQWVFLQRRRVICRQGCRSAPWHPSSALGPPLRSRDGPLCHGARAQHHWNPRTVWPSGRGACPAAGDLLQTVHTLTLVPTQRQPHRGLCRHVGNTCCLQTPEGLPGLVRARVPVCVES